MANSMLDERLRFQKMVKEKLGLNEDLRAGLRESILANQILKSLAYIELILDEMDGRISGDTEPKTTTTTPTKSTSKRKTTAKKEEPETAETKTDEDED